MTTTTCKHVLLQEGGAVELVTKPTPELEDGAVLLKTLYSEVCGTDVHLRKGHLATVPYPIIPVCIAASYHCYSINHHHHHHTTFTIITISTHSLLAILGTCFSGRDCRAQRGYPWCWWCFSSARLVNGERVRKSGMSDCDDGGDGVGVAAVMLVVLHLWKLKMLVLRLIRYYRRQSNLFGCSWNMQ